MQTRIRHYRKLGGLTLQQLADRVSTTPQTISRLETGNMTVSIDWLERFADVFDIKVPDLIAGGTGREIDMLGTLAGDGAVLTAADCEVSDFGIDVPADRPVAVWLSGRVGRYEAGDLLIGNRLEGADLAGAHGQDCLVPGADNTFYLRRLAREETGMFTLMPLDPGGDVRFGAGLDWAARIVMRVSYFR
ncbi:MAG: helix-turn-helix domain-containing protein [Candidatus Phaeomarinobacter sp.]